MEGVTDEQHNQQYSVNCKMQINSLYLGLYLGYILKVPGKIHYTRRIHTYYLENTFQLGQSTVPGRIHYNWDTDYTRENTWRINIFYLEEYILPENIHYTKGEYIILRSIKFTWENIKPITPQIIHLPGRINYTWKIHFTWENV